MVPGKFVIFLVYFLLYFLLLLFLIFCFNIFLYFSGFFVGFIYLVHVFPVLINFFFFFLFSFFFFSSLTYPSRMAQLGVRLALNRDQGDLVRQQKWGWGWMGERDFIKRVLSYPLEGWS